MKQAQNSRVREVVKKIENHPHRHALHRDLQQNEAYNPFSTMSKQIIQDVGNVELFELFETDPETQCTECLSYLSEGIVYCTCGHLLKETVANQSFIEYTLDLLSIPEYVIKKGRPHGHRYGKCEEVGFVSRVHAVLLPPSRLWKKCRRKCRRLKMNEKKRKLDGMESSKSKTNAYFMYGHEMTRTTQT